MLDMIPNYFVVHVQALQEEQAEEMKAKELEKQLAMMELDPGHLIAYVATQHPLYLQEHLCAGRSSRPRPCSSPPARRRCPRHTLLEHPSRSCLTRPCSSYPQTIGRAES